MSSTYRQMCNNFLQYIGRYFIFNCVTSSITHIHLQSSKIWSKTPVCQIRSRIGLLCGSEKASCFLTIWHSQPAIHQEQDPILSWIRWKCAPCDIENPPPKSSTMSSIPPFTCFELHSVAIWRVVQETQCYSVRNNYSFLPRLTSLFKSGISGSHRIFEQSLAQWGKRLKTQKENTWRLTHDKHHQIGRIWQ